MFYLYHIVTDYWTCSVKRTKIAESKSKEQLEEYFNGIRRIQPCCGKYIILEEE